MSVRSSVWKLKSRFARSPSAERVELLKGAIGALGEQHGKRAGADWARDNIPTEGAARKVLYALYRSFPPDEKDVFISYDWSDIQNALPYCPTVVDDEVDLGPARTRSVVARPSSMKSFGIFGFRASVLLIAKMCTCL